MGSPIEETILINRKELRLIEGDKNNGRQHNGAERR
jgi:hypothetical protein